MLDGVHGLESKTIHLTTMTGPIIVCVLYREPGLNMTAFLMMLETYLSRLPLNIPTIITGDFNVNILSDIDSKLIHLMTHYGFTQYVTDSTTDHGSALDHIYCNRLYLKKEIDVHDVYYSDHDAVFVSVNQCET